MLIAALLVVCLSQCPVDVDIPPITQDGLSGTAVAIDGDLAVIGCPIGTGNGWASGLVIVYRFVEHVWVREAELIAQDGAIGDMMGVSVDVSDGRVIAGAWFNNHAGTNSGAAYIFEQVDGQWIQTTKLIANDASTQDSFGRQVAIEGDVCVVTAPLDDDNGASSGSAYVFQFDGSWFQLQKLIAKAGTRDEQFGLGLAMEGERIVVGAPWADDGTGKAHIFDRGNVMFFETAVLADPNGESMDQFGFGIDVDEDVIVIGSYLDDDAGENTGSVFIYELGIDGWILNHHMMPFESNVGVEFGVSVSIKDSTLLVGSRYAIVDGLQAGNVTVFENWQEQSVLVSPNPTAAAEFGWAVALDGDNALIGAPWLEPDGEVQFFEGFISSCNCIGDLNQDGMIGVTDLLQIISVWGSCQGCEEDLDGNGFVDVSDLLQLISAWGECE